MSQEELRVADIILYCQCDDYYMAIGWNPCPNCKKFYTNTGFVKMCENFLKRATFYQTRQQMSEYDKDALDSEYLDFIKNSPNYEVEKRNSDKTLS